MIKKIDTTEQFAEIIKQDAEFFLLKHSLTCPISKAAFEEYEKFAKISLVDIIRRRDEEKGIQILLLESLGS